MPCSPSCPSSGQRSRGNLLVRSISSARGAMRSCAKLGHGLAQHVGVLAEIEVETLPGVRNHRSSFHPFHQRAVDRIGLFHGREVPAFRHDHQPRAGNAGGNLARQLRRRGLIAVADQDQGRATDRSQVPAREFGPRLQRGLLTDEGVHAGLVPHRPDFLLQRRVGVARRMHPDLPKHVDDLRHPAIRAPDRSGCRARRGERRRRHASRYRAMPAWRPAPAPAAAPRTRRSRPSIAPPARISAARSPRAERRFSATLSSRR